MRLKFPLLPLLSMLAGCGLSFNPGVLPALAETRPAAIPEMMMGALQEDLDLSAVQAAAILGNLAQETSNFTTLKQINGPAIGYSQWMGARKLAFLAFADDNGGAYSHEANYGFLLDELQSQYGDTLDRIRSTEQVDGKRRLRPIDSPVAYVGFGRMSTSGSP